MAANILDGINSFIDFFIHESFTVDTDQRYKVRLLVGCLLSFVIGIIGFGPYYSSIDALPDEAVVFYYIYSAPTVVFWGWLVSLLKQGKAYNFCAQSVLASCTLVLYAGIFITGGPAGTEVLPLVIIPVILAFLLLGQRDGLMWGVIVASGNYVMVAMDYFGYEFIQMAPPEAVSALRIFNWSYFFFTTLSLVAIYESMNRRLTTERNAERERFRHMAMHDSLTGLPNRKYFDDTIENTLALASRTNSKVAIGLLDLNGFKPINDNIGHDAGDVVLQVVADRLNRALRKSDKVARLGGDEFALILNNVKNKSDIALVSNKILKAIAEPIELGDSKADRLAVSGSLGVSIFPDDSSEENELRTYADQAMYDAKRSKSGWRLYNEMPESEQKQVS